MDVGGTLGESNHPKVSKAQFTREKKIKMIYTGEKPSSVQVKETIRTGVSSA